MTTDTPSTSREGVDIDTVLRNAIVDAGGPVRVGLIHDLAIARQKIAELIEAADILSKSSPSSSFHKDYQQRVRRAVAACRATPGAHP